MRTMRSGPGLAAVLGMAAAAAAGCAGPGTAAAPHPDSPHLLIGRAEAELMRLDQAAGPCLADARRPDRRWRP